MDTIYETVKIKMKVKDTVQATLRDPESCLKLLKVIYGDLDADQEHFVILTLNKANTVTGFKTVHTGGQDETTVDPKSIFRFALLMGATGLILSHNHPSGRKDPSLEDRSMTTKLVEAGKLLGIKILDHIILGDNCYTSFSEMGLL